MLSYAEIYGIRMSDGQVEIMDHTQKWHQIDLSEPAYVGLIMDIILPSQGAVGSGSNPCTSTGDSDA